MSDQRYSADLIITEQDFAECNWKSALANEEREGYSSMWQAFSSAARKASEDDRPSHGKALWLLADACSMMLSPKSLNEPFRPFMVIEGRRSVVPDDLSESDIAFYAEIVEAIDDSWLKARVADLVWLKQRPRDVRFALAAIDAYRLIPLDTETWIRGGHECWERAISLARMLKAGAGARLDEMEAAILDAFNTATKDSGFLALWLADLMDTYGLGRAHATTIAQKLNAMAVEFQEAGELHRSREFFGAASRWFIRAGDEARSAEMTVAVAEGWVKEAVARISSEQPSHMVAASFYEKAIQIYRSIPRSLRTMHQGDERIAELHQHMNDAGEKSLDELGEVKTPEVDITELVENARKSVSGKSLRDALFSFANVYQGARVDQIRTAAEKILQQSIFRRLAGSTHLSRDGRVIAKQPAAGFENAPTSDDPALWAQMVHDYQILINIVVHGDIWPAHEVLLQEHRLREDDFIGLASQSPIVPPGRERLFGKALYAGFDRDFTVSMHLLAPQIEHMVRFHLKNAGVKTTNLDIDGIENENGLSTLMGLPEAEKVFGKDLSFEIKALFCDALGPNLRNEVAHGLLDDDSFQSIHSIYAWWMGLRLVFNTFWNAARKVVNDRGEGEENDE
ncbi:DUF4209 domain-containing protein [Pseudomonas aeruginosa]|uniref:DUF4209 domain-containing protein n=1 Tax=Pseudomonas aeruginosa TaxID=287 RepID=UPI000F7484DD|nr:DUF4209 domain-containing protein [Pseudomonas aeruginosa]MBG6574139.1 DUF4209 domain-containing protein [Pseudomonas aeruginosa]MBH9372062.1 DUF4209 domain-containing protein [Pseudomonas aeruginosa]MCO1775603.1 DUF4209 domain-containing protein [Pseudomonas aeruginosa]MCV0084153.1 DUF4209 domain-containing protein [Pseudomonas aeruginosa]MDQ9119303.1 DUF4209 domain-containing protein [Pseudomonas aeruginosa]